MPKRPNAFAGIAFAGNVIETGTTLTREMYDALNRKGSRGRGRARSSADDPTAKLLTDLHYAGVPAPACEYKFCPGRRFAFDLAWPAQLVAVEIEGLVYSNRGDNQLTGRHVSVTGFKRDISKYGLAFSMGWNVLRVTSADARNGIAVGWLVDYFRRQAEK